MMQQEISNPLFSHPLLEISDVEADSSPAGIPSNNSAEAKARIRSTAQQGKEENYT